MITIVSRNDQREGSDVAVLESTGSKGSVIVNGTLVKKSTCCTLNSGDEVVFGLHGNHSYVSFYLLIFHFNIVCSSFLLFFKWELSLSSNYIYFCLSLSLSSKVFLDLY